MLLFLVELCFCVWFVHNAYLPVVVESAIITLVSFGNPFQCRFCMCFSPLRLWLFSVSCCVLHCVWLQLVVVFSLVVPIITMPNAIFTVAASVWSLLLQFQAGFLSGVLYPRVSVISSSSWLFCYISYSHLCCLCESLPADFCRVRACACACVYVV